MSTAEVLTASVGSSEHPQQQRHTVTGWRTKLYELNGTTWLDKGTGFVICSRSGLNSSAESSTVPTAADHLIEEPSLLLRDENNDDEIFFRTIIRRDDIYEQQGDNIIMWREVTSSPAASAAATVNSEQMAVAGKDYALSFQEAIGCNTVWRFILDMQHTMVSSHRGVNSINIVDSNKENDSRMNQQPSTIFGSNTHSSNEQLQSQPQQQQQQQIHQYHVLPMDFDTAENCHNTLLRLRYKLENMYAAQKDLAVAQLMENDGAYLKTLFRIFLEFEKNTDDDSLKLMADISRAMVLLNDSSLIEYIISEDDVCYHTAGIFEYDRTLRQKGNYREFLFHTSRRREVVSYTPFFSPLQANEIRKTATQLFRLKFLRDIMLHPVIDDPGTTALTSMISFAGHDLCTTIMRCTPYMASVLKFIHPGLDIDAHLHREDENLPHGAADYTMNSGIGSNIGSLKGGAKLKSPHSFNFFSSGGSNIYGTGVSDSPMGISDAASDKSSPESSPASSVATTEAIMGSDVEAEEEAIVFSDSELVVEDKYIVHGDDSAASFAKSLRHNQQYLIDGEEEELGPKPLRTAVASINSPPLSPRVAITNNGKRHQQDNDSVYRQLDAVLFLRELFALSRTLQMESRADVYNHLFDALQRPFCEVMTRLLLQPRFGAGLNKNFGAETSDTDNGDADSALVALTLHHDDDESTIAAQIAAEVLTSIAMVSPHLLQSAVMNSSIPSFHNPLATKQDGNTSETNDEGLSNGATAHQSIDDLSNCLLFAVIDGIVNSHDSATIQSLADVLKLLLEHSKPITAVAGKTSDEQYDFLADFYEHYLPWLIVPFLDQLRPIHPVPVDFYRRLGVPVHHAIIQPDGKDEIVSSSQKLSSALVSSRRNILEILSQATQAHSYRMKYFSMKNHILVKIIQKSFASSSPQHHWLLASGSKFIKSILATKDEFYVRHIEKMDLLRPVMSRFRDLNSYDNVATSSIHDVIEYIRSESIKLLVQQVVENFSDCFVEKRHIEPLNKLKIRYEQMLHSDGPLVETNVAAERSPVTERHREETRKYREMNNEEEYFFSEADEEDDSMPETSSMQEVVQSFAEIPNSCGTALSDIISMGISNMHGNAGISFDESSLTSLDSTLSIGEKRKASDSHDNDEGDEHRRGSYFSGIGIESSFNSRRHQATKVGVATDNPISLLDAYNSDEEEDRSTHSIAEKYQHSEGSEVLDMFSDKPADGHTNLEENRASVPLPPLKPKFDTDDDDVTADVFRKSLTHSSLNNKPHMNSNSHTNDRAGGGAHSASGGGISFSMKKKPRVAHST